MSFIPCNRYILIEREESCGQEEDSVRVLVPDDYKIEPAYGQYKVLDFAEDCNLSLVQGDGVVVLNSMVERVEIESEAHLVILENHVIGYYDGGSDD
jgi:co-chaperonin GroES (HSP10)